MRKITNEEALHYHKCGRRGKVEVIPTKPYCSQHDLSLAYTPGVAYPCLEIEKKPEVAKLKNESSKKIIEIKSNSALENMLLNKMIN